VEGGVEGVADGSDASVAFAGDEGCGRRESSELTIVIWGAARFSLKLRIVAVHLHLVSSAR
jgi:hypothetical protein